MVVGAEHRGDGPVGSGSAATASDSVRIYAALRTAHLERFDQSEPAQTWYFFRRADFDESMVDPDHPPQQLSWLAAVRRLATTHFSVVEVNEPSMVEHWPFLVAASLTVRLRRLVTRRPSVLVSYCIDNVDPAVEAAVRLRSGPRLARWVTDRVMRLLVRCTDRLAFGTDGAWEAYRDHVGERLLARRSRMFEALPSPCPCLDEAADERDLEQVVFVGSFVDRKGIRQTMDAWEHVAQRRPAAHLLLVGDGALRPEVEEWAKDRDEVTVVIDPPRAEVHRALRSSAVLVLLSQPRKLWREQVGLPIVEGLGHGCQVVTTTETGLAAWLAAHDHDVVEPTMPPGDVAEHILAAMRRATVEPGGSLAVLPDVDRRLEADRWLMRRPDSAGRRHGR